MAVLMLTAMPLLAQNGQDQEQPTQKSDKFEIDWKGLVIPATASLAAMGLIFGCGLAVASKIFEVHVDPKVNDISEALPKANCGGCGFAGCSAYAEAVVAGKAPPNLCSPGGNPVAKRIGEIMGIAVADVVSPVATIICTRQKSVKLTQDYRGIRDCQAAATLGQNIYECAFACLGLGTCQTVCPFHAIQMNDQDMPVVMEDRCTGCGVCVENCPVGIIRLTPRDHHVHILCASTELPAIKAKVHKKGACIACRKCVKTCPVQAISIVNNVAVIDYKKCTNCEACIAVCPTTAIFHIRPSLKKEATTSAPNPAPNTPAAASETNKPA